MIALFTRRRGRLPRRSWRFAVVVVTAALAAMAASAGATASSAAQSASGTGATSIWPGGTWTPEAATYGVYEESDVPITMSDGVVLHATVDYPADKSTGQRAAGTFPVLYSQNPYGSFGIGGPDDYYVERGYIYVSEDIRGTTSRSTTTVNTDSAFFGPRNAQDGVDTVNYLAHDLPGSNGTIGLVGCSFLGISQLFTAADLGPNSPVKAMVPACASMDYNLFFSGGIPGETMSVFGLDSGTGPGPIPGGVAATVASNLSSGGTDAYASSSFWSERDLLADSAAIVKSGIPTLLWTGEQALEEQGALDLYTALQNNYAGRNTYSETAPGDPVSGRYQIVVGSGGHASGLDDAFQLEWFDQYLKGENTGISATTTPMHIYEGGTGRWINLTDLPDENTTTSYNLGSGQSLSRVATSAGTESLTWAQPTSSQSSSTLVFNTAPVLTASDVAGPVEATVYASSSSSNLELVASLEDVSPSGSVTGIADGALIGSMRQVDQGKSWYDASGQLIKPYQDFSGDTPLTPGQVEPFDIKLPTVLYQVPAGDHLRLVISSQEASSNCTVFSVVSPALPCNPTSTQAAALTGSTDTVYYGGTTRSVLSVPLVNPYSLPATLGCATSTSSNTVEPMNWNGGTRGPRNPAADALACQSVKALVG
jgi:uncharacterized protein